MIYILLMFREYFVYKRNKRGRMLDFLGEM